MQHIEIKTLLEQSPSPHEVTVKGWVRSFRSNRFIALNDGSTIRNIQCVVDFESFDASLKVTGLLVESQGQGQAVEIQVSDVKILGEADPEEVKLTILSPKRHSMETLREQAHLRIRTNTFSAVMRTRSRLAFAIHDYFQKHNFFYMHSPIIK